ncbi:MAG: sulfatase [Planctomycetota bacterium]
MADRPNILYVFSDQQAHHMLSCAGNEDLQTPHMDGLAGAGVRFTDAYCPFPLCTPCRASMFTGRYPHELGITWNSQPIGEADLPRGLGRLLSEAGYDCAYGGKWHVPEIAMPEENVHGFRRLSGFNDAELPGAAAAFLREAHDRPWFLVCGFDNPHNVCEHARHQWLPWGQIPDAPVADCPNLPPNAGRGSAWPEALSREQESLPNVYVGPYYTEEEWRRLRHGYARMTEFVDAGLGVILDALRDSGQWENTLIVYASDHGDAAGAHGWNQKTALFEEVARVPFLVKAPGADGNGGVDGRLVHSAFDFYATALDYAGLTPPDGARGTSLRPALEGAAGPEWRDHVVIETHFGHPRERGAKGLMARAGRHKYVLYSWGRHREQLFDLERDPGELVNLAVESRHAETLDRMRALVDAWCRETDYNGFGHYGWHGRSRGVPGHEYDDTPLTPAQRQPPY